MKYLLVMALVLVVFWVWRSKRNDEQRESRPPNAGKTTGSPRIATEVVACRVCQVHLPRSEALPGPGGLYCSAAHRQQAGD